MSGSGGRASAAGSPPPASTDIMTARARRQARSREAAGQGALARQSVGIDSLLQPRRKPRSLGRKLLSLLVWCAVLAGAVYVALLPYPYEVGGDFVVQPFDRAEVRARTDGEVVEVLVGEGDQVEKGQVLARILNWQQKRDVEVLEARIAKTQAELATLIAPPRQQEVALAEQRIETAQVEAEAAEREFDRAARLAQTGAGTTQGMDTAQSAYQAAVSEQHEAQAELALLRAPVVESEADAARADIARNERDLDYKRLLLENTEITATIDGRVVTPQDQLRVGKYLPVGGLFLELEDTSTAVAEIEVPETDILDVTDGADAELKLWSAPTEAVEGTVMSVSPIAEERDYGRIVRVQVAVPNAAGMLKPDMTGFAKIEAPVRPVWEAFTRAFVRFFRIEVWSWIP